jgi:hypothetical protein
MNITLEQYSKIRDSRWPIGTHQGIRVRELSISYLKWMVNNGNPQYNSLTQVAEMELLYRRTHPEEVSCGDFDLWPSDMVNKIDPAERVAFDDMDFNDYVKRTN